MRLFGYTKAARQADVQQPEAMAEVALEATPEELRRIAQFFERAAADLEHGTAPDAHLHLDDVDPYFAGAPALIAVKAGKPA